MLLKSLLFIFFIVFAFSSVYLIEKFMVNMSALQYDSDELDRDLEDFESNEQ